MADLSRPRTQASATVSKKVASNGNGFAAKNAYQDVFGGPPKFGFQSFSSRIDDYCEIFGGYHASRGSSIPFLDLPDVDESAFLMDVRSSNLNYSEVFGGSGRVDFAVPYEELFAEPVGVESSSEDVWTPAETGSPSEGSSEDPSCSDNIQAFSNGKSHHPSYESVQQINTFHHKSKLRSTEDGICGITHVAELNAVPAYTLVVDEDIPTQKEKYEKPLHQVSNEGNLNLDSFIELTDGTLLGEKNSRQATCDPVLMTSENIPRTESFPDSNGTSSEKAFLTVTEINLRTRPSQVPPPARPPPRLFIKEGESKRLPKRPGASNISKNSSFEGAIKDALPVFYDVEVDASSPAAASAAAMKEAMEKAEARLRSAKVSMERKREGLHNRKKFGLKEDFKVKEKAECEIAQESCKKKEDNSYYRKFKDFNEIKCFDVDKRQQTQSSQVPPAFEARTGLLNISKDSLDEMSKKEWIKNKATHQHEGAGEFENKLPELVHMDKFKPVIWSSEQAKDGTELMIHAEVCESQKNAKPSASMLFKEQEGKHRKLNVSEVKCVRKANEKITEEANDCHQESKKNVCVTASNGNLENCINLVCEQGKELEEVYEQKMREEEHKQAREDKKNEFELDEACQWVENENKKYAKDREENAKRVKVVYEHEDNGDTQKKIPEPEENERKQEKVCEREGNQQDQIPACEGEDQICQEEAFGCEEHDLRAKFLEQEENEKQQKECGEENLKNLEASQEGNTNEKRQKEAGTREQIEKQPEVAHENGNESEKQQKEVHKDLQEEENAKELEEAHESIEIQGRRNESSESEEEVKIMKEALEPEENDKRKQVCEEEDGGKKFEAPQDSCICKEEEKNLKTSPELCENSGSEQTFKVSSETFTLNEDKATYEFHGPEEENNSLNVAGEPCEEKETKVDSITVQYVFEKDEEPNAAKVETQPLENEVLAELHVEPVATEEEKVKPDSKFECDCNENKLQEAQDAGEDDKNIEMKETAFSKEEDKIIRKEAHDVQQENGHGSRIEAEQPTYTLDEKRDGANVVYNINKGGKVEVESNLGEVSKVGERVKEERIERQKEQEMERLRKLEEEREREREREKDRMAVERVTREARERAFAEARERAERAAVERVTAEARQRAMAEARERLEKASVEARLRAERAAVERATAEAQERAMEKAMAGKTALGAKERMDRSVSDKYSASSRDCRVKHSASFSDLRDSQFQSSGSFNGSQRYPDSSSHTFATEKSHGVEAVPAQRCKARLERHQRTVQRAANALAEKNKRDLLVQREQAERHRLAETLDADVKRWSSGKEGNLRALLSTLQYILGPESGWQPVPLTEVITAVAVKKAYRKATLCVHPDKLQQRGASIQQKYICEKVFDLLKEAWNKFNSEER